jgi:small subunit ribosomal protein S1
MKKLEDFELNEEENFAKLFEESEKKSEENAIVEGTIVQISEDDDFALVDVGQKSEGKLNLNEIKNLDGSLKFNVGDKIKVIINSIKGERPIISHKRVIQQEKFNQFINKYGKEPENLEINGIVQEVKKSGFVVIDNDGLEYFMPLSQGYLKTKDAIGKKIKAKVLKAKDNGSIIISRKKYIDDIRAKKDKKIEEVINKEGPITGTVKKITSYGMFVDLGGIDGLVSYNEISYKGPVNPALYFEENDEVEVVVKNYDKDKGHLALSVKDAMPNPWDEIKEELDIGDTISVIVSNFETYGAFVDLGNDIEGLLHIGEITWDKNIKKPQDYLTLGQEIEVEVIELDTEKRKLRVSLKRLQPKPFDEFIKEHKVGDIIKGTVATITEFGAFINLGLIDGLLHNEESSWTKGSKCKDILKKGDEVEVQIIKIDKEKENVSLSIKTLQDSLAAQFAKEHKIGDIITAPVKNIKEFGIFVKLGDDLDGLIRKEDLHKGKTPQDYTIGKEVEAAIINIDKVKNKIRLSIRRVEVIKEKEALKKASDNDIITLADAISNKM